MSMALRSVDRAPFTYAHLRRLREQLDDRQRYEIIGGDLAVTPSPSFPHQVLSARLQHELFGYVTSRGLGIVVQAPLDVVFSDLDVVQPDLIYLTAVQVARAEEYGVHEAPTLLVEILSPSTARRDRHVKRDLYARMGVPHYWLLDPLRRMLEAFALREGDYALVESATGAADFRPALFPDLVLHLGELWPARPPRRPRSRG
jgi:Uma2 family endonuclease